MTGYIKRHIIAPVITTIWLAICHITCRLVCECAIHHAFKVCGKRLTHRQCYYHQIVLQAVPAPLAAPRDTETMYLVTVLPLRGIAIHLACLVACMVKHTDHYCTQVEGDVALHDLGHGLPLRMGTFDGAISISAVQWLCNADKASHEPRKRMKRFFETLYSSLTRGARAVLQVMPCDGMWHCWRQLHVVVIVCLLSALHTCCLIGLCNACTHALALASCETESLMSPYETLSSVL